MCSRKPYLYGHRALQDIAISGFILLALFPFNVYDRFRGFMCDCSLHNILVYRDPGGVPNMTEVALDAEDLGESFMQGSLRTRLFAQGLKGYLEDI